MNKREKMEISIKNAPQGAIFLTYFAGAAVTVVSKRGKVEISINNASQGIFV